MEDANKNLVEIYKHLDDLKSDFRNKNLMKMVVGLIGGEKVLEIGCGNGILLGRLQSIGKKVFGLEPSRELAQIARGNNKYLQIIEGRAEDLQSLISEKFDTVVMVDVLEHIEDDNALSSKVCNVLNAEGEFVIVVPAYQFAYGKRDKSIGHYRRYNKKMLRMVLERNGFEIVKFRCWNMLGVLPYVVAEKIFKKPLNTEFRGKNKNIFSKFISFVLDWWFILVENNINLGFGLSLMCVAKKRDN